MIFLKRKKRLQWLLPLVLVLVVLAGGGFFIRKKMISKAVSVFPVSTTLTWGFGDEMTMEGEVTDAAVQKVILGRGLVDKVNVKTGSKVKKGDCLMKYNKESVKLAIQADEASIALLEAERESARADIQKYQALIPSEEMPEAREEIIHHKAEPVALVSLVDVDTPPSADGNIFYCSMDTKVTAAMLQKLDDTDQIAEFRMYQNNVEIGSWRVDGSRMSSGEKTVYIEKTIIITPDPDPAPTPEPDPEQPSEDAATPENQEGGQLQETVPGGRKEEETRREEQAPYADWVIGEGLEFNGDGTVAVDYSLKHYGKLQSVIPEEAEWDETVIIEPDVDMSGENYVYSRKDLAQMIQDKSRELDSKELEIKEAELKLQQDKLVSSDGKVLAGMDGVVTEVRDPSEVKVGDPLITIKGNSGLTVTVHVSEYDIQSIQKGEILNVTSYETASSFAAEVTDISFEPEDSNSYSSGSRGLTYYPVTATVTDPDIELNRGEWCQVSRQNAGEMEDSNSLMLPMMLVRKDDQGSYCMIADDSNRLKKVYVKTGKTMWGSYVEILYGIKEEDRIAFPYGKNVNVGSSVIDKESIMDVYE